MSAESDIAAINDGGANTAAEVRTALTSVLARAPISPTFTGAYTDQDSFGAALAAREAFWIRFYCRADVTVSAVSFWANAAPDDVRLRVARVTGGTGNSTVAEILHETAYQPVSAPAEVEFTSLDVELSTDTLYAFICEVETGSGLTLRGAQSDDRYLARGDGALVAAGLNGSGHCSRGVTVSGTLTAFANSLIVSKIAYA